MRALVAEICSIREKLTGVMNHDWVSVPLVYTQVVTLAVYFYFTAALIGAQVGSQTGEIRLLAMFYYTVSLVD